MASAAITKTTEISDLRLCKEESIYERLQRITVGAKKHHRIASNKVSSYNLPRKSVREMYKEHKDKAIRTALLYKGSINY